MKKSYLAFALAAVLALALSVSTLVGPGPSTTLAANVNKTAKKALRIAKKARKQSRRAKRIARDARGSAGRALRVIGDAQVTADQALAASQINTTRKLGIQPKEAESANNDVDFKQVRALCPAGKDVISGFATTNRPAAVVITRIVRGVHEDGVRETVTVAARELPGVLPSGTSWLLKAEAICVNR